MFLGVLLATATLAGCAASVAVTPSYPSDKVEFAGKVPVSNLTVKPISLQINSFGIQRVDIAAFCAHHDTIQLGPCSGIYVKCSRYIREVEYHTCSLGKVYNNGRCVDVADLHQCKDIEANAVNLETEQLARRQNLCKRAENSVFVASAQNQCSRHALVCDKSGQPHSFICPVGEILDAKFLTCVSDQKRCTFVPRSVSVTVKQNLVRQYCARHSSPHSFVDPFAHGIHVPEQQSRYGSCETWYIDCRANFQALIHCEPGRMYDPYRRICRAPSYNDNCQIETSCVGYEWNILPAGKCKSEFVFCNGLKPKKFICDHGKVFHKGKCYPLEQSDCPLCEQGDLKTSAQCNKYFQCEEDKFGRRTWNEMECPQGEGFSESAKKCETDFACSKIEKCRPGASYKFSCTDYMVCLNGEYEYRACPHMTSWDVNTAQCEYDKNCREPGREENCREDDVIPSTNCQTYFICKDGDFEKKWCEQHYANDACAHCKTPETRRDQCEGQGSGSDYKYNDFKPVQCRHGDRFVNTQSCSEYVECLDGVWYTRVCPSGFAFDSASNGCRRSEVGKPCGFNGTSIYVPSKENANDDGYKTDDRFVDQAATCNRRMPQRVGDMYDCGKYKMCNLRSGFYEDRSCLYGEQFDPRKGECVWGHQCNATECTDGATSPRPGCGKLQLCRGGKLMNLKCKNNAVFENNACSTTKFCSDDDDTSNPINCVEGMTAEHSYDCSKYLLCFRGNFVERQCGNGQNFNPNYGRCDYRHECSKDQVPPCYHGERRAVVDEHDKYELCQDNRFVVQSCPLGMIYKQNRMRCELEPKDDDHDSESCTESPLPEGFKPHPTDCSRFYQCAHGRWAPKSCQPSLFFNPALAICDWPRNVPGCD